MFKTNVNKRMVNQDIIYFFKKSSTIIAHNRTRSIITTFFYVGVNASEVEKSVNRSNCFPSKVPYIFYLEKLCFKFLYILDHRKNSTALPRFSYAHAHIVMKMADVAMHL